MQTKGRVLVVDDDRDVRGFIGVLLAKNGFEPIVVSDGATGLDILEKNNDIILVLLDLMMPVMDGLSVLKKITQKEEHPPVLMITARSDSDDVVASISAGASDYIVKPVNMFSLNNKIDTIICKKNNLIEKIKKKEERS